MWGALACGRCCAETFRYEDDCIDGIGVEQIDRFDYRSFFMKGQSGFGDTVCCALDESPKAVRGQRAKTVPVEVLYNHDGIGGQGYDNASDASDNEYDAEERKFHNYYRLGKRLGGGAFGQVYPVTPRRRPRPAAEAAAAAFSPSAGASSSPPSAPMAAAASAPTPAPAPGSAARAPAARGRGKAEEGPMALVVKVSDLRRSSTTSREWRQTKASSEAKALGLLVGHANVVAMVESFVEDGLSYIVMQHCDETLRQHLDKMHNLSEATLRPLLRGMLQGIAAAHSAGVVHRDVKPANFLCAAGVPKLCDFELAGFLPVAAAPAGTAVQKGLRHVQGTTPFLSPEMLSGQTYDGCVDVWAFGVIMYTLLFGGFPYCPKEPRNRTVERVQAAIVEGVPAPTFAEKSGKLTATHAAEALTRRLLNRDPATRSSAAAALRSAFFTAKEASSRQLHKIYTTSKFDGAFDESQEGLSGGTSLDSELLQRSETARRQREHRRASAALSAAAEDQVTIVGSFKGKSPAGWDVSTEATLIRVEAAEVIIIV